MKEVKILLEKKTHRGSKYIIPKVYVGNSTLSCLCKAMEDLAEYLNLKVNLDLVNMGTMSNKELLDILNENKQIVAIQINDFSLPPFSEDDKENYKFEK